MEIIKAALFVSLMLNVALGLYIYSKKVEIKILMGYIDYFTYLLKKYQNGEFKHIKEGQILNARATKKARR